jgi:hypothetical protein
VPSELPVDINGFKSQQYRWARGSIQTGKKLLGRILKAPLPLRVKLEAFVHLTNNWAYLLMVLLSLLVFPAMLVRQGNGPWITFTVDLPLFLAATVSVLVFYWLSQTAMGDRSWGEVRYLPSLMGLGIGLSINNARAVLAGAARQGGVFHRTPKYRIEGEREDWRRKQYRVRVSWGFVLELVFALYLTVCLVWAVRARMWYSVPFLYLFFQGYWYMVFLTVSPYVSPGRLGRAPAEGAASGNLHG